MMRIDVYGKDNSTSGNFIQGNYIGTNAAGNAASGNGEFGISVEGGGTVLIQP